MSITKHTLCLAAALTFSAFIPQTVDNYAVATAAGANNMTEKKIPVGNFTGSDTDRPLQSNLYTRQTMSGNDKSTKKHRHHERHQCRSKKRRTDC